MWAPVKVKPLRVVVVFCSGSHSIKCLVASSSQEVAFRSTGTIEGRRDSSSRRQERLSFFVLSGGTMVTPVPGEGQLTTRNSRKCAMVLVIILHVNTKAENRRVQA